MRKAFLRDEVGEMGPEREEDSSRAREEGALTAYFRQLGDRLEPVPEPTFDRFWRALSWALKRQLHRRGLWESPPRFVGIEAAEVWGEEALEELAAECFVFLMQRLQSLHQHLKLKPNIDGLVLLNVRHFLYERQKTGDPLGFRIFDVARSAVRQATEDGTLRVVAGDPRIENSTVLQPRGRNASAELPVSTPGRLQEHCRSWVDALLPDLILARGRQRQAMTQRLAEALAALDTQEVGAVTFKVLVDALKAAARVRWTAVWVHEQGGKVPLETRQPRTSNQSSAVVFQQLAFEDEESFRVLVRNVSEAVESAPPIVQHRQYLSRLWEFLRTSSADPGNVAVPSRRRVAELLGIPRYLLPELYGQLGKIIERCREPKRPAAVECRQGGRVL